MLVAEAVGRALAGAGRGHRVRAHGQRQPRRHQRAARRRRALSTGRARRAAPICMADGYGRVSGRLAACSVHQGPGLTNAVTGLTEAAKSRTPLIVLAADMPSAAMRSNFRIDQVGLVEAVGATAERVHGPATAHGRRRPRRAPRARRAPRGGAHAAARRAGGDVPGRRARRRDGPALAPPRPGRVGGGGAGRPAGAARGARRSSPAAAPCSRAPGRRCGRWASSPARCWPPAPWPTACSPATPTTSASRAASRARWPRSCWGRPTWWSPSAPRLNQWTTSHGKLLAPDAAVVQVDLDEEAIGAHRPVALGVVGDAAATAEALLAALAGRAPAGAARRTPELAAADRRRGAGATSPTTRAGRPACSIRAR